MPQPSQGRGEVNGTTENETTKAGTNYMILENIPGAEQSLQSQIEGKTNNNIKQLEEKMEEKLTLMPIDELNTVSPFKDLFPIRDSVLIDLAENMRTNGFDMAHPIIVWAGEQATVVDGHSRLAVAKEINLDKVPVILKEFPSESEALKYAIKSQTIRRNLTAQELLKCLIELDKKKPAGRPEKLASSEANSRGKSSESTAKLLGISRNKVEKLRTIKEYATDAILESISNGEISINEGYKETMKARRQQEKKESPRSEAELMAIKEVRTLAILDNIVKLIKSRLEWELQEYPDICYSQQDKSDLMEAVASKIGSLISTILPGEEENDNSSVNVQPVSA